MEVHWSGVRAEHEDLHRAVIAFRHVRTDVDNEKIAVPIRNGPLIAILSIDKLLSDAIYLTRGGLSGTIKCAVS
jgi:hypothetical protein